MAAGRARGYFAPEVLMDVARIVLVLLAFGACRLYPDEGPADCADGADNDQDGAIDCEDDGCLGTETCPLPDTGGDTDTDTDTDSDTDTDTDADSDTDTDTDTDADTDTDTDTTPSDTSPPTGTPPTTP